MPLIEGCAASGVHGNHLGDWERFYVYIKVICQFFSDVSDSFSGSSAEQCKLLSKRQDCLVPGSLATPMDSDDFFKVIFL